MNALLIYAMIFVSPVLVLVAGTGVVRFQRLHPEYRAERPLNVAVGALAAMVIITVTFVILVLAPLLARP